MYAEDLPTTGLIAIDGLYARPFAENLALTYGQLNRPAVYLEPTASVRPSVVAHASTWKTPAIVPLPRKWLHRDCEGIQCAALLSVHADSATTGLVIGELHRGEQINLREMGGS